MFIGYRVDEYLSIRANKLTVIKMKKEPLVRFPSCTAMTLYYINVGEKSLRLT